MGGYGGSGRKPGSNHPCAHGGYGGGYEKSPKSANGSNHPNHSNHQEESQSKRVEYKGFQKQEVQRLGGEAVWPYGAGGRCGPEFAAAMAETLADLHRLGVRGALDHWLATGRLCRAVGQVLTEGDVAGIQRALDAQAP